MTAHAVIHVVDDDDSLRAALRRLLEAAGYTVRTHASAGAFLLEPPADAPGCLLLDLRMPGPSGLDLQSALERHGIRLPVIFLTGHGDLPTGIRAMKAGAVDFLTKPVESENLFSAIARALERDTAWRESEAAASALRDRFARLTARERDVLDRVVAGKVNKLIAYELGIAERTVKARRAQAMAKLGVASAAELGAVAARLREVGE